MAKIRIVNTASGAKAVQVVRYFDNKRKVLKHFGSAHTAEDLQKLKLYAEEWLKDYSGQLSMFKDEDPNSILYLSKCVFLGVYYNFFYEQISSLQQSFGYSGLGGSLLNDFVIIRLLEPCSKLKSIELLEQYFGLNHNRQSYYKLAPQWATLKKEVVQKTIEAAKSYYNFDYSIVFYDVTTLYFESFKDDELRKTGFSKDGKSQQPQILVALIVTKEGFPVGYDIFSGNTFEGHTIIPAIKSFVDQNTEVKLTVVADAAMISAANISELKEASINYIVGARLANCKKELIELIDNNLERADGKTIRIETESGWLICGYSVKRYKKDKFEMDKQIEKAKEVVKNPSKAKKTKFTKAKESGLELNEDLTQKTEKLLGIKGYYTDLDESILSNSEVIERYHDLYKVEHAFRISKHDLQTRPIFHNKEEPIKLHILICFMSLAIARHIELQTGVSINKFISEAKKVADARMLNQITGKEIKIRAPISSAMSEIIEKLHPPH